MLKQFTYVLFCLWVVTGCIEHRPVESTIMAVDPEEARQELKQPELRGLRVYEGKVPCADCPVVEQRLALKGDSAGIFRLTETFKEATIDGDEVLVTTGEWRRYRVEEGGEETTVFYLSEGDIHDSTRVQRYAVSEDRIVQRDIDGKPLEKPVNYTLKLIRKEL